MARAKTKKVQKAALVVTNSRTLNTSNTQKTQTSKKKVSYLDLAVKLVQQIRRRNAFQVLKTVFDVLMGRYDRMSKKIPLGKAVRVKPQKTIPTRSLQSPKPTSSLQKAQNIKRVKATKKKLQSIKTRTKVSRIKVPVKPQKPSTQAGRAINKQLPKPPKPPSPPPPPSLSGLNPPPRGVAGVSPPNAPYSTTYNKTQINRHQLMNNLQPPTWNSSVIWELGYDAQLEQLLVLFNSGACYLYYGIKERDAQDVFDGIAAARTEGKTKWGAWFRGKSPSVGAAYNRYIKGKQNKLLYITAPRG